MKAGKIHQSKNFGAVEIINYVGKYNVHIRFLNTGSTKIAQSSDIRRGSLKDNYKPNLYGIGFIGDGEYSYQGNEKAYSTWHGMLDRCYNPKYHEKYPTYINCTTCESWLNFQNFAPWFYENYKEGLHLDKDIRIKGNKHYSPDTCKFVTCAENTIEACAQNYKFLQDGIILHEVYNLAAFCREKNLNNSCMSLVHRNKQKHHKGWTKA